MWRIGGELSGLASRVRELHEEVTRRRTAAGATTPPLAVVAVPSAAANEAATVPVPARRSRGPAVRLPNGERRIDYIRDRYYRDGMARPAIRAEVNQMLADAGQSRIAYQVVFAATSGESDPRENLSRRGRRRGGEGDSTASDAAL